MLLQRELESAKTLREQKPFGADACYCFRQKGFR